MAEDDMFSTSEEGLPHRCIEVVYMITLLRDGYGFPEHSRNVTYALEADGMEVRRAQTLNTSHASPGALAPICPFGLYENLCIHRPISCPWFIYCTSIGHSLS